MNPAESPILYPEEDDAYNELDEGMFKKAKEMHANLNQPRTLKQWCFFYYIDGVKRWVDLFQRHSYNVFNTMPEFIRDELLRRIHCIQYRRRTYNKNVSLEDWCRFVFLIMKKNIDEIDSVQLMFRHQACEGLENGETVLANMLNEMLAKLAEESPNLKKFSLCHQSCMLEGKSFLPSNVMDVLMASFKSLAVLDLRSSEICVGNELLPQICLNFPDLVCLKLDLAITTTTQGLALLPKLKKLRLLRYNIAMEASHSCQDSQDTSQYELATNEVFNWCGQNLPHLEYLGSFDIEGMAPCVYHLDWYSATFSGTSSLRALISTEQLPEAVLPNLRTLYFKGPILCESEFAARASAYHKLTSLTLLDVDEKLVSLLLNSVGHQLTILTLKSDRRFGDHKILALCPKLKELENEGRCHFEATSHFDFVGKKQWPLKRLVLSFNESKAPKGLFQLIFSSSPELEFFYVDSMWISKEDCEFFCKIKSCSLDAIFFEDLVPLNCSVRDLQMLVRCLAVNCPKLLNFRVHLNDDAGAQFKNWDEKVQKFLGLFKSD